MTFKFILESNPFESLSEYDILHILSFLPGRDLLNLSELNTTLNRIITKSRPTMKKIRLVMDFEDEVDLDLDYAMKLSQSRRFTALELTDIHEFIDTAPKLLPLLELLKVSVDDLVIGGVTTEAYESYAIIPTFLPKLKKCTLNGIAFEIDDASRFFDDISSESNNNHPLEALRVVDVPCEVFKFFEGCKKLKSFHYGTDEMDGYSIDISAVNDFLAPQTHLEKLIFNCDGLEWDRLTCFQLNELSARYYDSLEEEIAASKFLGRLPNLTKLNITIWDWPSRRLLEAICKVPKLEKLAIQVSCDGNEYEEHLDGLVNNTVKKLKIIDGIGVTRHLLLMFRGVESVILGLEFETLDLSDVPIETIEKIERIEKIEFQFWHWKFDVKFSSAQVPTTIDRFESAVLGFIKKWPKEIIGITIGHENWRNTDFSLSNRFCENLVSQHPKLATLELFYIEDSGRFMSFLTANRRNRNVKSVKLHELIKVGEPKPKKMRLEVD